MLLCMTQTPSVINSCLFYITLNINKMIFPLKLNKYKWNIWYLTYLYMYIFDIYVLMYYVWSAYIIPLKSLICMPVSIIGLNLKSTVITVLSNNGNHAVM